MITNVNFSAILISTIASIIIGIIWYTPLTFGKAWMKLVGLKESNADSKTTIIGMTFNAVSSFISFWVLAVILQLMGIPDIISGLLTGFTLSVTLIAFTIISNNIYELRSFKLSLLNAGYRIIIFTAAGAIIGAW